MTQAGHPALAVYCPACLARAGQPCTSLTRNRGVDRVMLRPHPRRIAAAAR